MKKTVLVLSAALLVSSVYAFDSSATLKTTGSVSEYTKTEYSITEKFGDYYRSPKAKFTHIFDGSGKETEASELTNRDSLVDRIMYTYESGRVKNMSCTDADGKLSWKMLYEYDAKGRKIEEASYNAAEVLMNKTIWKYPSDKQIEESFYNADGALLSRTITKLDEQKRNSEVATYRGDGSLDEKKVYTYNDAGKLAEVAYSDATGSQLKRVVYRFDASYTVTEKQTYNSRNKLSVRVIFKYDSVGNIVKETTYNVAEKFGTTVNELAGISEYSLKYGRGSAATSTTPATTTTTAATSDAK